MSDALLTRQSAPQRGHSLPIYFISLAQRELGSLHIFGKKLDGVSRPEGNNVERLFKCRNAFFFVFTIDVNVDRFNWVLLATMDDQIVAISEPWVPPSRRGVVLDEQSRGCISRGATLIKYHCIQRHAACLQLAKRHGVCLCGHFLLATCRSRVQISAETWTKVLDDMFEGIDCHFWGRETFYPGKRLDFFGRDTYLSHVIVQVKTPEDHHMIFGKIEDRFYRMQSPEFEKDSTREAPSL